MRSLLIVPAVAADKLDEAFASDADALILDLAGSVAAEAKTAARAAMAAFVAAKVGATRRPALLVRINGFSSGLVDADLDAAVAAGCDAIVLPKAGGGMEITRLDAKIAVAEAVHAIPEGRTRIFAEVAGTAHATLQIASYRGASRRLVGMACGSAELADDLGVADRRAPDGGLLDPFRLARTMTLIGAAAADCAAIDDAFEPVGDAAGLAADCLRAVRDGFTGKLATDPADVATINAAFTPDAAAVGRAERVVAAFAGVGDAPTAALDGMLLDRTQLARARRLIGRAEIARRRG